MRPAVRIPQLGQDQVTTETRAMSRWPRLFLSKAIWSKTPDQDLMQLTNSVSPQSSWGSLSVPEPRVPFLCISRITTTSSLNTNTHTHTNTLLCIQSALRKMKKPNPFKNFIYKISPTQTLTHSHMFKWALCKNSSHILSGSISRRSGLNYVTNALISAWQVSIWQRIDLILWRLNCFLMPCHAMPEQCY